MLGVAIYRELPPRTRRIRNPDGCGCFLRGTTSAHAENTLNHKQALFRTRNYLRARGEYAAAGRWSKLPVELPPRTRRIHKKQFGDLVVYGTTSAHAENTSSG